ncbi:hypothetical protein Xkoz_00348 [Xenorhabdus kozodoii]|uniref:Uncharacterized protein n=1 Tax=Xenorhabdus kozodoii TaxID=351676 RepID=A0A2D0LGI4_9GAMM|nr:hypothetical protein Xkoz_00348 [Xenorhabdus kozodoii]
MGQDFIFPAVIIHLIKNKTHDNFYIMLKSGLYSCCYLSFLVIIHCGKENRLVSLAFCYNSTP